jgi:hypothetical protein
VKPFRITFGIEGGNLVPWHVTVDRRWSMAKRAPLLRDVHHAFESGLRSRQCPGTLPDLATRFISAQHRTARVHGDCELVFTKLWNELVRAAGPQPG